ncbi:MAG: nuclear transport factor 2 family protein [Bacteroidota bacterium]
MKQITISLFLLVSFLSQLQAQNQAKENAAVIAPIKQLFEGMMNKDTNAIKAVFHPDATLNTVQVNKEGKAKYSNTPIEQFITGIGKIPTKQKLEEKILSYEVKVDGNLASVWTPYEFYFSEQFSHCGVNVFTLFKSEEGWLITAITDTRRREGCQ